jgi:hypothetical protein
MNSSYFYTSSGGEKHLKLLILFKIKTVNNQFRTISHMQTINLDDIDKLNKLFF